MTLDLLDSDLLDLTRAAQIYQGTHGVYQVLIISTTHYVQPSLFMALVILRIPRRKLLTLGIASYLPLLGRHE